MHMAIPLHDALDRLLDSRTDNLPAPLQAYEISLLTYPPLKVCLEPLQPCGLFPARNRKKGSEEAYHNRVNLDPDITTRTLQYQEYTVDLRLSGRIIWAFRT